MLPLQGAARNGALGLAERLAASGLDPDACYRVSGLRLAKENLTIYFNSGYLILALPVNGVRPGAYFASDLAGGDGELLLLPPDRAERLSLARFTGAPNMDAHFRNAMMVFSDDTASRLQEILSGASGAEPARKDQAIGQTLAGDATGALRSLYATFSIRLVHDLLSPSKAHGVFVMATLGSALGPFDAIYDPSEPPRITVGQHTERGGHSFFNIWSSFVTRSAGPEHVGELFRAGKYSIDADLDGSLAMHATTRLSFESAAAFDEPMPCFVSHRMTITGAELDGVPMEVFQPAAPPGSVSPLEDEQDVLLIPGAPISAGRHEIVFHHQGSVVDRTAGGVYFVSSRGSWYPQIGLPVASFDIRYRYPKALTLVSTGDTLDEGVEGGLRFLHTRTAAPIRFAGFNLGEYSRVTIERGPYRIQVCANRASAETSTRAETAAPPIATPGRRAPSIAPLADTAKLPNLEHFAAATASAFGYMESMLGPPPVRSITVSPIPGTFGQGFPGLVYLSTLAYLDPDQLPPEIRSRESELFYSDLLEAHEIAHQWWGNLVAPAGPEDDWLPEALANYSALMYLENRKGAKAVSSVLDEYRKHLLVRDSQGRPIESNGPIVWGARLRNSEAPNAWRIITYEKGTWIIHMLRVRLGEEKFTAFLREICRRYAGGRVSTKQFQAMAAGFLPPGGPDRQLQTFFDYWVYGTGIPELRLRYTVRNLRLSGSLTETAGEGETAAWIPIVVTAGEGEGRLHWVESVGDSTSFSFPVRRPSAKAVLSPDWLWRTAN